MTQYSPPTAAHDPSGHQVTWQVLDDIGSDTDTDRRTDRHTDTVTIRWENEGYTVGGTLSRERVEYVMRLSSSWHLRQFILFRDLDEPDLWLATDGHGRWGEMNGAHRTELDGCLDLALDAAAFSHAMPVRRLPLHVGHTAEIPVIVVDLETLEVVTRLRRYSRTGPYSWSVDDGPGPVAFDVDEFGLPIDVGQFRRAR